MCVRCSIVGLKDSTSWPRRQKPEGQDSFSATEPETSALAQPVPLCSSPGSSDNVKCHLSGRLLCALAVSLYVWEPVGVFPSHSVALAPGIPYKWWDQLWQFLEIFLLHPVRMGRVG